MTSTRKSEAARANGAKSRGPKTAAGLAISSRNSLRHGFTSRHAVVLECENADEFQQLLADYQRSYNPATPTEQCLVEQMVAATWRIRRLMYMETALFDSEILRRQSAIHRESPHADSSTVLAIAFRYLADQSRSLSLLLRYSSALHRTHDRAYAALRELQQARKNRPAQNEPIAVKNLKPVNHLQDQAPSPALPVPNPPAYDERNRRFVGGELPAS